MLDRIQPCTLFSYFYKRNPPMAKTKKEEMVTVNYCITTDVYYNGKFKVSKSFYEKSLEMSDSELLEALQTQYPEVFSSPQGEGDISNMTIVEFIEE